ncbi:HNH endonuclease [Halomonas beimenensis]|uniref:HNH nuclease domain-containing protein n=1 Tax=Halomonas beimenensis TaxID=475662 RepID=A0A291P2R0_9GAMM|nr:HNH endonuclease [Halomonas beimenensis]ATJ81155.1 hypothetical protein BEI_0168 [Halomonas beimenensis]
MQDALECLTRLRTGLRGNHPAPNQPCLLLAILCEIQSGHIRSPEVTIDTRLIVRYCDLYEIATGERGNANPWLPLWALRRRDGPGGPLWMPRYSQALSGVAEQLGQPKSMRQLEERFTTARLAPELFETLSDDTGAREASAVLIGCYFAHSPSAQGALHDAMAEAMVSGAYERRLDEPDEAAHEPPETYEAGRSAAFRRLVLEAYDYRCAASRRRFITPDYRYLAEAAHLIPFAESGDDRPCNGLALTPDLHWAMDNHLIAPGPDLRWHISSAVDPLVEDNRWLHRLHGTELHLPRHERHRPSPEGLHWRMTHLLR